ncbi:MAG: hydroxyacid dehydrogenase [Agathobacter sp.]|nr:hydroxyacid dehydrogenase [Agathobacter sp.]
MSKKYKVFVAIPKGTAVFDTFVAEEVRAYLEEHFEVTYNELGRRHTKEELKIILQDFDAVLTGWGNSMLDRECLEGNDRLKLIVHTGGTVGNLIDDYVYQKGIKVLSGNKLYAESVAEGTIAYMLMALRKIPDYIEAVREGNWRTEADLWEGLLDRTVGIVGVGTISRIVIRMLQTFRVKIKVYSHYEVEPEFLEKYGCELATLDEIFSTCDIVSVHSALNEENRGLIQRKHFEMLKDGSLFINTARGAVIDEEALIDELQKNRFSAVLDVYIKEPLPQESRLRSMKNVYPLPHMAGPTLDRRKWITKALIDNMLAFFDGTDELGLEISEEYAKRMTKM